MTFFDLLNTATNGLEAQREKMNIISGNISNSSTPGYKRKIAVLGERNVDPFAAVMAGQLGVSEGALKKILTNNSAGGAVVSKIVVDKTAGEKIYFPNHPQADKDGYVEGSNVDTLTEMLDMMYATRNYKANLSIVEMVKSAARETLNMGKAGG